MESMIGCVSKSVVLVSAVTALSGCASSPVVTTETSLTNPPQLTVILPNDKSVNISSFTNFRSPGCHYKFKRSAFKYSEKGGAYLDFSKDEKNGNVIAKCVPYWVNIAKEARVIGQNVISYNIQHSIEEIENGVAVKFRPVSYKQHAQKSAYVGGIELSDVEYTFTVNDIFSAIISQSVSLKIEIDSPYKTESVYANFRRLAKERKRDAKAPISELEGNFYLVSEFISKTFVRRDPDKIVFRDPDGKVIVISEGLSFHVKVLPYQDGSKAIVSIKIPSVFTLEDGNTLDFRPIINEIKSQLESIAKS